MNIKTKNVLTALVLFIVVVGIYIMAVMKALSQ
jgi:hypothetical protein